MKFSLGTFLKAPLKRLSGGSNIRNFLEREMYKSMKYF